MHTSGKVLAWFVVVGSLAAIYLSAKTLGVRKAWMEAAQKNEADFLKNQEQIFAKTRELTAKRAELARTMLGWDNYWPEVDVRVNADGTILTGLGTTLGLKPDQVVYVFAPQADGSSKYVGDFKLNNVRETQSGGKANWFLHAGDLTPGQFKARLRTMIPNQHQARLGALDQQLLAANLVVVSNQAELERQAELLKQSEQLIAKRLSEINGDADLQGKKLPEVHVKGLLAAMRDEEEARNAALIESDQLMRDLKHTREEFMRTLKANRQLTEALPGGVAPEPKVGSVGG
jgi:hypothetical protein